VLGAAAIGRRGIGEGELEALNSDPPLAAAGVLKYCRALSLAGLLSTVSFGLWASIYSFLCYGFFCSNPTTMFINMFSDCCLYENNFKTKEVYMFVDRFAWTSSGLVGDKELVMVDGTSSLKKINYDFFT
jgi:hypothetical protein